MHDNIQYTLIIYNVHYNYTFIKMKEPEIYYNI